LLVFMWRFSAKPMPSTKTKYNSMISQSIDVRFKGSLLRGRRCGAQTEVMDEIRCRRQL
jgi:hypothetical protein